MPYLDFSKLKRVDGGIRYAIALDYQPVLHRFSPGPDEEDPVLVWYIDVRCRGRNLPSQTEEVRQWFITNAGPIKKELLELASSFADPPTGFAELAYELPVGRDISNPPTGTF